VSQVWENGMRLREVLQITQAQPLTPGLDPECEVQCAFASDLMSDVLRFDMAEGLLVTGLANPQVVRTAEMADAAAILMVRGKDPHPETMYLADQVGIPILGTPLTMFEACGQLYRAGLAACVATGSDSGSNAGNAGSLLDGADARPASPWHARPAGSRTA
jgi:hypothetical protein